MENTGRAGIGLPGILTIVFVVLKLVDVIDWSWWWVLSPLWISAPIWIAVIAIGVIIGVTASAIGRRR